MIAGRVFGHRGPVHSIVFGLIATAVFGADLAVFRALMVGTSVCMGMGDALGCGCDDEDGTAVMVVARRH